MSTTTIQTKVDGEALWAFIDYAEWDTVILLLKSSVLSSMGRILGNEKD